MVRPDRVEMTTNNWYSFPLYVDVLLFVVSYVHAAKVIVSALNIVRVIGYNGIVNTFNSANRRAEANRHVSTSSSMNTGVLGVAMADDNS